MVIHSPKTEHHKDGGERIMPILPDLLRFIQEAWEAAEEKAEFVIADPMLRRMRANLGTGLRRIIELAKVKRWPKAFQNLRASRETKLMAKYPARDIAGWIGNSVPVALAHYAMQMEESFERAIREGVPDTKTKTHHKAHHSPAILPLQETSNEVGKKAISKKTCHALF